MSEKFANFNCAQMAAIAMWMLFCSLKLQCKLHCFKHAEFFDVTVFFDAGTKVEIPKGYCYSSKQEYHYPENDESPAFETLRFTFEY